MSDWGETQRKGSGDTRYSRLSMREQCAPLSKMANHTLGYFKHTIASRSKGVIHPLYLALVWPPLEYCVLLWTLQYKKVKVLERIQRRSTNLEKGPRG